jgi:hypothetical protein
MLLHTLLQYRRLLRLIEQERFKQRQTVRCGSGRGSGMEVTALVVVVTAVTIVVEEQGCRLISTVVSSRSDELDCSVSCSLCTLE